MSAPGGSVSEGTMFAHVRAAWTALPNVSFAADESWEDAGGDSLLLLQLQYALERALERTVPLDLITPETTPAQLAHSLASQTSALPAEAPLVYLVPGMGGDERILADFRRSFAERIRFDVVDMPGLDAPARVLASMTATARFVADEIERRTPSGDLVVGGFSFGGLVAFEAARQLAASGRTIALVVILDSFRQSDLDALQKPQSISHDGLTNTAPRHARPSCLRFLTRDYWRSPVPLRGIATRLAPANRARVIFLAMVQRFRPRAALSLRRTLLVQFRAQAMEDWRATPLALPAFLAVSERLAPLLVDQWHALCADLEIVRLPGGHLQLFDPLQLGLLVPALEVAVHAAVKRARA